MPSTLTAVCTISGSPTVQPSSTSRALSATDRVVISSTRATRCLYRASYTCFARYGFSPHAAINCVSSASPSPNRAPAFGIGTRGSASTPVLIVSSVIILKFTLPTWINRLTLIPLPRPSSHHDTSSSPRLQHVSTKVRPHPPALHPPLRLQEHHQSQHTDRRNGPYLRHRQLVRLQRHVPPGSAITNIGAIGGPITQTDNNLTGTFRIDNPCFGNSQTPIPLTGSITSGNKFSLTSPSVNGETLTLTGTFSDSGTSFTQGYLGIAGPCTGNLISQTGDQSGSIVNPVGTQIPNLSGDWNYFPGFRSLNLSEQLNQSSTPDADGRFALSGNATIIGSPCFTSGTLQPGSYISGTQGHEIILLNDGSPSPRLSRSTSPRPRAPHARSTSSCTPATSQEATAAQL